MKSSFCSSRFFHTEDGWFVYLRNGDERGISYMDQCRVHLPVGDSMPVVGPFVEQSQVEKWLENFLTFHGRDRNLSDYIVDNMLIPDRDGHCVG